MLVSGDHKGGEGYLVLFNACTIEINTKSTSLLEFHRKLVTIIKNLDPPKIMKKKIDRSDI